MNAYEAKQEARRERLDRAADRAEIRSNADFKRADLREEVSGIPLGQPILVGHHSEGRHRAAIKRADNAMRKSVEESKKAGQLRARAASVGTGGISSDDPEAVAKLKAKVAAAEQNQTFMKAANKVIRAAHKAGVNSEDHAGLPDYLTKLHSIPGGESCTPTAAIQLATLYLGSIGFPGYRLTNNNANIRRMKQRLAQLDANSVAVDKSTDYGIITVKENPEENRVQLFFDGKPSAEIRQLVKQHGFRWAPSQDAWQRQLNNASRYKAGEVVRILKLMGEIAA
jgi:uncharacterized protein DUF3560